ncbi:MAG: ABC transporter ATP-binding protein [Bacteroidaceae bacterium]|nr:ABC transporter ATP-binding protein [Bacteroidaceae bacterium]
MIVFRSVAISFGSLPLFTDLSFRVRAGEMAGICGPSGSGKTSLLRAMLGFVSPSAGDIEMCGKMVTPAHIDYIRRHTAFLPQDMHLPAASVRELVAMTLPSIDEQLDDMNRLWEDLGLETSLWDAHPAQLSGGQRQRILLATALLRRKPILIADEPTSALDSATAKRVIDVLRRSIADFDTAILVASHDQQFLAACDKVIKITPEQTDSEEEKEKVSEEEPSPSAEESAPSAEKSASSAEKPAPDSEHTS